MTARSGWRLALLATLVWISLSATASVVALDWGSYADYRHNRFYEPQTPSDPQRQFIGEAFDWSGVGVFHSDGWWWATMISDKYFLSAAHILPSDDAADVRFYRTNDSNGEYADATIDTSFGQQIAGTDLWLGRLNDAPPAWVHRYPLIKRNDSTNYVAYLDPTIYLVGYQGNSASYTNMRVGMNEITTPWSWSYSRTAIGRTLDWTFDAGNNGFGADEARTIGGDSSGPTFVKSPDGTLALAGIHWQENRDSDVTSYISQLIAAVPEPVTVVTDLPGDVNADFQVTVDDLIDVSTRIGTGRASTRLSGDGHSTGLDLASVAAHFGKKLVAPADFNQDYHVDDADLLAITSNWLQRVEPGSPGDANFDGIVNVLDLGVFAEDQRPPDAIPIGLMSTFSATHGGVPEPSSAALLSVATLLLLPGRRRGVKVAASAA